MAESKRSLPSKTPTCQPKQLAGGGLGKFLVIPELGYTPEDFHPGVNHATLENISFDNNKISVQYRDENLAPEGVYAGHIKCTVGQKFSSQEIVALRVKWIALPKTPASNLKTDTFIFLPDEGTIARTVEGDYACWEVLVLGDGSMVELPNIPFFAVNFIATCRLYFVGSSSGYPFYSYIFPGEEFDKDGMVDMINFLEEEFKNYIPGNQKMSKNVEATEEFKSSLVASRSKSLQYRWRQVRSVIKNSRNGIGSENQESLKSMLLNAYLDDYQRLFGRLPELTLPGIEHVAISLLSRAKDKKPARELRDLHVDMAILSGWIDHGYFKMTFPEIARDLKIRWGISKKPDTIKHAATHWGLKGKNPGPKPREQVLGN